MYFCKIPILIIFCLWRNGDHIFRPVASVCTCSVCIRFPHGICICIAEIVFRIIEGVKCNGTAFILRFPNHFPAVIEKLEGKLLAACRGLTIDRLGSLQLQRRHLERLCSVSSIHSVFHCSIFRNIRKICHKAHILRVIS